MTELLTLFYVQTMLPTAGRLSKVLQLTLAVIKPDAVAHPMMLEVSSHTQYFLYPFSDSI